MNGGQQIAQVLANQGVRFLFTLCGGHISPILVGAKQLGIRVIDVRDEATAVFAADAVARLTGIPGVAAVTAGPGITNTVTAVKNAQLAQSPLILLGGAAATVLKGRGALQDIDQLSLMRPHVKEVFAVDRVRNLVPVLEAAFQVAQQGIPGPVFVECAVDLLYDEPLVRDSYTAGLLGGNPGLAGRLREWYVDRHLSWVFARGERTSKGEPLRPRIPQCSNRAVRRTVAYLERAERPVMLVGSQALLQPQLVEELADAVTRLAIPLYASGMARGLLPPRHPLLVRHSRKRALREADLVILAGAPMDFRLQYGSHINRAAVLVTVNRSRSEAVKNRRPTLAAVGDPATFLTRLASATPGDRGSWTTWCDQLRARDDERHAEIGELAARQSEFINPLHLCQAIDHALDDDSIVVLDGGDFVATASYVVSPRGPLRSLDPGVFGTLGVGAGFALGAKLCRPSAEVWILYGDGSAAFSLAEFDTFVRHNLPVIAVVGNDACWTQIARGQREMLKDDVGTALRHSDYHCVIEGYGGKGFRIDNREEVEGVLAQAKTEARNGVPILVNALIGATDFRSGSISM